MTGLVNINHKTEREHGIITVTALHHRIPPTYKLLIQHFEGAAVAIAMYQ